MEQVIRIGLQVSSWSPGNTPTAKPFAGNYVSMVYGKGNGVCSLTTSDRD